MNGLIQPLNDLVNNFGLPQDFIVQASFYALAALTCIFALGVVTSRNIFHCAIFLAVTLFCVAGVYLFLNAEFLAIVQVLIYVGAIVTLFIFAIMLTANISDKSIPHTNRQVLASGIIAITILVLFVRIITGNPWKSGPAQAQPLSLREIGRSLMSAYALPFEVISLILLAALVGAIVIGKVNQRPFTLPSPRRGEDKGEGEKKQI